MRFLLIFAALAAFGCQSSPKPEAPAKQEQPARGVKITHGPMLGRPGETSIGIWARTSRPAEVTVFYGRRPDAINYSKTFQTRAANDNTGWILLESLDSSAKYYYEITTGKNPAGIETLRGSFHTLPSLQDVVNPDANPRGLFNLRFEIGSGNDLSEGPGAAFRAKMPAYATMRRELVRDADENYVDFAILNGGWLRANDEARRTTPEQWAKEAGATPERLPKELTVLPSLAGVWENYKRYLSEGSPLADWHRNVPSYFTFDDDEIVEGADGAGEAGRTDRRSLFRDIGLKGWYDYLGWANEPPGEEQIVFGPARLEQGSDVLVSPEANFRSLEPADLATLHIHWGGPEAGLTHAADDGQGGNPNAGVYEVVEVLGVDRLRIRPAARATGEASYSIGKRSYWRKRFANVDLYFLDTRSYRTSAGAGGRNEDATMLGAAQKEWLKLEMRTSNAAMFFVVSPADLTIPHFAEGAERDDAWTAYRREREELIQLWDSLNKPIFVLTGGLRNSFAIQVTDNVWEFASGPVNAANDLASNEGGRPPNGRFNSGGRDVDIHWSSYMRQDIPVEMRDRVIYAVVRVTNVFRNEVGPRVIRWVAYPKPQVVVEFHDGVTGEPLYAESVVVP